MKANRGIDPLFVPLVAAASNALGPLIESAPEVGPSTRHTELRTWGDITGAIKLNDDPGSGILLLGFERQTILELAGILLAQRIDELTGEVEDAVAELTNIVCAHAKTELSELGYQTTMQRPWVLRGKDVLLPTTTGTASIRIPLTIPSGTLVLEMQLPAESASSINK